MSLNGKVAIVTGSGAGLGLAYAQELARQGAKVVINDVNEDVTAQAVETITSAGGTAIGVTAPVCSTETAEKLVNTSLEEFGTIDIMVNHDGIHNVLRLI